ncbi:MAG: MotA/TolQ/ExbB proton channel family protein [Proteobacteria bacterium]|nr:MotA/TolQ/ExbB proton channel family protein [Pseudomonadota bacterium]
MDIATGLGFLAGIITVSALILMGGSFRMFYDVHALIVIGGGCTAGTLIRFPLSAMAHGFPMGIKYAFSMRSQSPRVLIEEISRVADIYKKGGATALDQVEVHDPFLKQALRFLADGYDADFMRRTLEQDRDTFFQHLDEGQKIYRSIGDAAPAWGMVGTLVGMVQMFSNMEDPSKLGPFMAVALLATLYGALVGNLVCLPIADKLHVKLEEEDVSRNLIIDGVLQMRASKSPAVIREMLISYLPDHHKHMLAEAA